MPGIGASARATEPVPEPSRQYYGPLRICDENFAFDLTAGEGFVREGGYSFPYLILSTGGYLTIGGRWTGDSGPSARYVHARGEIELQGQTLRRFEVKPPDGGTEFAYTAPGFAGSERFTIRSNRFDGSDRDRAILDRIVLGDRARQMCASVPLELRPLPERDQPEVRWLAPARYWGPLTICRAGLAFDVTSQEEAMVGWGKDHLPFRIIGWARITDIAGFDGRLWRRAGEKDVQGSLSRDPRFVTWTPLSVVVGQVPPSSRPGSAYGALRWRADPEPILTGGAPALFFTFDRDTTDAERQAFIARVRTQRPNDRCFARILHDRNRAPGGKTPSSSRTWGEEGMRRFVPALLCLAMLGFAAPARATTEPPPVRYEYYGPVRICDRGFAFDVRKGEGYLKQGYPYSWTHFIMWSDGYLNLGEPWTDDEELLKSFARPLGELEVAGQRLQRFDISSQDRPRAFAYVYEFKGNARRYPIESNLFDGSERDRAILERIQLGERAREACAAVPAALKPQPKEQWSEAFWLPPDRHPGPLTVCAGGLAFDIAAGEAAALPWRWRQVSSFFRVIAGDGHTDVAGLEERVWRRGGEADVEGPVALDPRFTTRSLGGSPSWVRNSFLDSSPEAELVLLSRRTDALPHRPEGNAPVSFTFDRPTTESERKAFVQRLRTQRPGDRCFGAGRP